MTLALGRYFQDIAHLAEHLGGGGHLIASNVGKGVLMENADPGLRAVLPHLERIGHHREPAVAAYLETVFNC